MFFTSWTLHSKTLLQTSRQLLKQSKVAQSCPTLCNPTDCSLPGSSVHGDSPGNSTGVGCRSLLQGIFPETGLIWVKPERPGHQNPCPYLLAGSPGRRALLCYDHSINSFHQALISQITDRVLCQDPHLYFNEQVKKEVTGHWRWPQPSRGNGQARG